MRSTKTLIMVQKKEISIYEFRLLPHGLSVTTQGNEDHPFPNLSDALIQITNRRASKREGDLSNGKITS